jgi:uncharacterized protein with FMN-binding domain
MNPQQRNKRRELIATLAVLIVVVAIVGTVTASNKKDNTLATDTATNSSTTPSADTTNTTTDATPEASSTTTGSTTSDSGYIDGTYKATGSFSTPGGIDTITINVTLKSGTITATSATGTVSDRDGQEYQDEFISNYEQQVVGKNVDSVSLTRVSGASLTTQGFNDALSQIKQQAQSA